MSQNKSRNKVINNREICQKTVGCSIRRLLWDIVAFPILAVLAGAGYLLAEKLTNKGLIGMGIIFTISVAAIKYSLCQGQSNFAPLITAVEDGRR